jgi:hypothetical protein
MFRKFALFAFAIALLSGAFGMVNAEADEKVHAIEWTQA